MSEKITYCRLCECMCGLIATVENNEVITIKPDPDHPITKGFSCPKGLAMRQVTHDPKRILYPLRKGADGDFARISWETAIKEIGERLNHSRVAYGNDSIGFYAGNPISFSYSAVGWVKGMADALDTPHFYSTGSQDLNPRFVASALMYGSVFTWPTPDMYETDFMLLVGANPVASHGSLMGNLKAREALVEIVDRGGRVVVIDPRRTETAKLAEHVPIQPGGDVFLLLSLLHVIFAEGLDDLGAAKEYTTGLEELRNAVKPYSPTVTAQYSAVSSEVVTQLARDLAKAGRAVVYGRLGTCTVPFGTLTTFLLDALNVVTGNVDTRGGMIFASPPVNAAKTIVQRGYDTYGATKSRIGGFPDVWGMRPGGVLADEINTPGKGQLRSMIVVGGNPVLTIPESGRIKEAFNKLDLLVSLDFHFNDYNVDADYILPTTTFLEREDTSGFAGLVQQKPFIQWTEPVIPPQGEARQEWEIIRDLCAELNIVPNSFPEFRRLGRLGRSLSPGFLFDLMLRLQPAGDAFGLRRGGLSVKKLKKNPHGVLLADRMPVGVLPERLNHDDKRLHLFCDEIASELKRLDQSTTPDEEYPFRMFGRRESRSMNTWMKNAEMLRVGEQGPVCSINPEDARKLGLSDGEFGRIRSRTGEIEARFEVSEDIIPGSVCVPHGWSSLTPKGLGAKTAHFNANDITSANPETIERLSGTSVLNGVRVQVKAVNDYRKVAN